MLDQRVDFVFRNSIALDVVLNFHLVITEIAQRVKNLCHREVWQSLGNFFWRFSHAPKLDDGAHWRPRTSDYGFTAKNVAVFFDMGMGGWSYHNAPFISVNLKRPF